MKNLTAEEKAFYDKKFYFSYSSIYKLIFSPRLFYNHYVLRLREDVMDQHLLQGKLIHCLFLEPEKFKESYTLMPSKFPGDNVRKLINVTYNHWLKRKDNESLTLQDFEKEILDTLLLMNLHQKLKEDEAKLKKVITSESISYFEYLKQAKDKTVVDLKTYDHCEKIVNELKNHEIVKNLFMKDMPEDKTKDIYNELELISDLKEENFGFKGIIDNLVVDHTTKRIFINDLKTTSKAIQDFPESVEFYKYWIQAVIYKKLVENFVKDSKNYEIFFTFTVIDKYGLIYPYQVSKETLTQWEKDFDTIMEKVSYHYNENQYTLPYELAKNIVKL